MLTIQDLANYLVFIAVDRKGLTEEQLAIMEGIKLITYDNFTICDN